MNPEPKEEKMINISEIFYSIQGEGIRAGKATIFIRFFGCNLRCSFCDTQYAIGVSPDKPALLMTPEEIMETIEKFPGKEVCITGGEPFMQPEGLFILCWMLRAKGYYVQVETNGSLDYPGGIAIDHVTFSPKMVIDCRYYSIAKEIKVIISTQQDVEKYKTLLDRYHFKGPRYLQPNSMAPFAVKICIEAVKEDPAWRLSLQLHSIIGIR